MRDSEPVRCSLMSRPFLSGGRKGPGHKAKLAVHIIVHVYANVYACTLHV